MCAIKPHSGRSSVASFAVLVFLATIATPAAANEETLPPTGSSAVALSEQRAAEAFQAYSKNDYVRAVALYMQAYESAPSGSILYNVARIYDMKLGDRPLAISFYRRYIANPGAHTELIVDANQRLRELRETELVATKAEADSNKGETAHLVETRPVQHGQGGDREGSHSGWSKAQRMGVVLGALGLAGIGVGVGFGLAAMSRASTANEMCQGNACASQRGVDAANGARREATISNIGFAAGGALLVTGGVFYLLGVEANPSPTSRAGIRLGTRLTANDLSLQVSGKW